MIVSKQLTYLLVFYRWIASWNPEFGRDPPTESLGVNETSKRSVCMGVNGVVISCVKDVSVTCRVRKYESALLLISHVKNVRHIGSHVNLCCNESCYKKKSESQCCHELCKKFSNHVKIWVSVVIYQENVGFSVVVLEKKKKSKE